MRINSITLTNIRSYLNETIYFGEGVNFISGPNGTGKTTIVESIGFALFNATPDFGRDVTQFSYFVRYGCTSGKIYVEIEDNKGEQYSFERKINKRSTSWTVYEKETGIELNLHGSDDVKEFIREHIDIDKNQKLEDVFTDIIGVSQGSFTMPFLLARADRIKHFNTMLNVLEYRKAADKGSSTIKYYNELIDESQKNIAILTERLSNRGKLQEDNLALNKELTESNKELITSEREKLKLKTQVSSLNAIKNKYIETEKTIENLRAQILAKTEALRIQMENLNNAYKSKKIVLEYQNSYEAYKNAQEKSIVLEKQKEQKEYLLRTKIENENKFNILIAEANNKIAVYKNKQETADEQINNAKYEIKQIEEKIKTIENSNVSNQTKTLIADAENKMLIFHEYLNTLEKCNDRVKAGLEKWKDSDQKLKTLEDELKNGSELLNKSKAYENALIEKEKLATQIGVIESNIVLQKNYLRQVEKGICPVCHSNCGDIENLKKEITDYLKNIKVDLIRTNKKIEISKEIIQKNKHSYEAAISLREKEAELDKLYNDKQKYSEAFDSYSNKIKNIQLPEVFNNIIQSLDDIKKATDIKSMQGIWPTLKPYNNDPEDFSERIYVFMTDCRNIYKNMTDLVSEAKGHVNSALNNAKKLKIEYEESIIKQNKLIDETNKAIENIDKSIQNGYKFIETKKKEYIIHSNEINDRLKEFQDVENLIQTNRVILNNNKNQYELYMSNFNIASKEQETKVIIETIEAEKVLLGKKSDQIKDSLSLLRSQFNEDMLDETNEAYSLSIERSAKARSIYEQKKNELHKNEQELKRLSKEQQNLDSVTQEYNKQKKGKALAKIIFDDVLKNAGEKIGGIYRQRLTSKANNLFKEMTNENAELIWEDDYNVMIVDYYANEKRQRVFRQLSGGEQMATALSIRLSFIAALTNTRIAFFDEPTTNLDSERRNNLAELLPSVINDFKQVFVISHDDTFDSVTQNLIKLQKTREGTKNS